MITINDLNNLKENLNSQPLPERKYLEFSKCMHEAYDRMYYPDDTYTTNIEY